MSDKQKCFIIMPITTPESYIKQYSDDSEHFIHILENLFIPAVEAAGLEAIPPIAEGSENIQANIIENLEAVDLVLCDMSIYNPNVFFELGIRTALNKATCLVKDNFTASIPFDNRTLNTYTYNGNIKYWHYKNEIEKLTKHINESKNQINDGNALWKYFGMKNTAKPAIGENTPEAKLDYLIKLIENKKQFDINRIDVYDRGEIENVLKEDTFQELIYERIVNFIKGFANQLQIKILAINKLRDNILILVPPDSDKELIDQFYTELAEKFINFKFRIIYKKENDVVIDFKR